jgi:heme exporter protein A
MQVLSLVHPYIRISRYFPINISVEKGDVLAVCGANGSGKTTFLHLLLNELSPQKGTVKIDAEHCYLGIKNGLKPQLTIRQQLPYFASNQLTFPWPEWINKPYKDLSSGQQRLVALWMTLHRTEPLILMDEPFSHLDGCSFDLASTWINTQLDFKKTIIFTHHHFEELKCIKSLQVLDLNE